MFADTVAAEAVPAARALAPIAVKVAIRARWRRVELLTSGDPFLAFPEPTARRAVAAGPRSVVVMHTYAGARSLLWPSQVSGPTRPRRATPRGRTGARQAGHPPHPCEVHGSGAGRRVTLVPWTASWSPGRASPAAASRRWPAAA